MATKKVKKHITMTEAFKQIKKMEMRKNQTSVHLVGNSKNGFLIVAVRVDPKEKVYPSSHFLFAAHQALSEIISRGQE